MDSRIRRRLEMADRVLVFNQTHPPADTGLAPMFAGLEERVTRASALMKAQEEALGRAIAGRRRRTELRRRLVSGLLRLIPKLGQAAAREDPSAAGLFRPIPPRTASRAFIPAAEALVAAAETHLELLAKQGFSQALLDEAKAMVAEYVAATNEAYTARQARIQARGQLVVVAGEITRLVNQIDGLNKHRFAGDPDVLATWRNARNVIGPVRPASGGGSGPAPGGAGGDARAAA